MTIEAAASRYIAFCEGMTPEDLDRLAEFCAADIHFRDPFNDVTGLAAYRRVLAKMFSDVGQPEFVVTGRAVTGRTCFLRWQFSFSRGGAAARCIDGMSEIRFGVDDLVAGHFDFWDAGQVYEMVPLLGSLVRMTKRRLSIGQ